jgi:hypothetical protein
MRKWAAIVLAAAMVALPPASALAAPRAQASCEFILGFKILADWLGAGIVGTCMENQRFAFNGNAEQLTTQGLMAWRKADNWTAFTDGYRTWINGPFGVQERLNTECYPWEVCPSDGPPQPVAVPTAVPAPPPQVPATPTPVPPTATPAPKPGDVLYRADWSGGLVGWVGSTDWKTVNGMLVNDGSNGGGNSLILAPYQPTTPDYALETEIEWLGSRQFISSFAVVARANDVGNIGYRALSGDFKGAQILAVSERIGGADFDPGGQKPHTYRLEVRGNTLKLLIDGGVVLSVSDNRFLSAGRVGLWSDYGQMNVRSFKVIAL